MPSVFLRNDLHITPFQSTDNVVSPGSLTAPTVANAFAPTANEYITLAVLAGSLVIIAIVYNVSFLSFLLGPLKLVVVIAHESMHALMATVTGASVQRIKIHANESGATDIRNVSDCTSFCSLPAGYIGTYVLGGALIFAGFDDTAAAIAAAVLAIWFIIVLVAWAESTLTRVVLGVSAFVLVGLAAWHVFLPAVSAGSGNADDGGHVMHYFVVFIGTFFCYYSIHDFFALVTSLRRAPDSDPAMFAKQFKCLCCTSTSWAVIWFLWGTAIALFVIFLAIAIFR